MRLRMTTGVMAAMALASAVALESQESVPPQPAAPAAQGAAPSMNTARHAAALAAGSRALHYCTDLFRQA
jgi:hypothetical protein